MLYMLFMMYHPGKGEPHDKSLDLAGVKPYPVVLEISHCGGLKLIDIIKKSPRKLLKVGKYFDKEVYKKLD